MLAFLVLPLLGGVVLARAADRAPRANAFQQAETQYRAQPENTEAAWKFARACFDEADAATNKQVRATFAERGIAACREALARSSNSAPVHYYLGLNLGQLASTRGLSALKLVSQMESELLSARELDPKFDFAGPDRSLGLLYRDAPSMLSVGSKSKARRCLERAIQVAPHYPDNRLEYIDTLLKWGDHNGALRELKGLEAIWAAAKAEFSAAAWSASWAEWGAKLEQLKNKLQEPSRLETPRH